MSDLLDIDRLLLSVPKKKSPTKTQHTNQKHQNPKLMGKFFLTLIAERKKNSTSLSTLKKEIPFFAPHFALGTQFVEVRLYLADQTITFTGSTAYNTVYQVVVTNCSNWASFAVIFDEFRYLRGEVCYVPQQLPPLQAVANGIAVLDYGDSTALTSMTEALSYDNKKMFNAYITPNVNMHPTQGSAFWPVQITNQPDKAWTPVGSVPAFGMCTWKPRFDAAQVPATILSPGYVTGWIDVQFRGMNP
jgi:hypothetical protein